MDHQLICVETARGLVDRVVLSREPARFMPVVVVYVGVINTPSKKPARTERVFVFLEPYRAP